MKISIFWGLATFCIFTLSACELKIKSDPQATNSPSTTTTPPPPGDVVETPPSCDQSQNSLIEEIKVIEACREDSDCNYIKGGTVVPHSDLSENITITADPGAFGYANAATYLSEKTVLDQDINAVVTQCTGLARPSFAVVLQSSKPLACIHNACAVAPVEECTLSSRDFVCQPVSAGGAYFIGQVMPTVCGCPPVLTCPSGKVVIVTDSGVKWSDGSAKAAYTCSYPMP